MYALVSAHTGLVCACIRVYMRISYMCLCVYVHAVMCVPVFTRARKPLRVGVNRKVSVRSGADDMQACKLRS